jgi:hypothetical protein
MDLLSTVGQATKRREDYFSQAKALAKKYKTQESLEDMMAKDAKVIVKGLRDKQMRWDEYERTLLDKTLISALAAVYLGAGNSKPDDKMEKAWPTIIGDMLPPLVKFLSETETYVNDGTLRLGDKTMDFADYNLNGVIPGADDMNDDELLGTNPAEQGAIEAAKTAATGRTWPSLFKRVVRYVANPSYSFYNLGSYMKHQEQGYKEMQRVGLQDKKTCKDCTRYHEAGWQPIGSLPMPGKGCTCFDNCRCSIEYR